MARKQPLGWGILGTGRIAKKLADAINASVTGRLVAVGSRSQESADAFGEQYQVPHRYGRYEGVLENPEVQAVYISLPNHLHAPWTIRCAEAGKHILCEKPLAMNFPEAMTMLEETRRHRVFLMEAFMYRCHPQTAKLVELVRDGAVGEVRVIQASFSYNAGDNWQDIRMVNPWGGGGIMDVGCYTVSMARLLAGAATGKDFAEPLDVKGAAVLGSQSRVDEWAVASLTFPGAGGPGTNILADLACGMRVGIESVVRVWGSKGHLVVPTPWFAGGKSTKILLHRAGAEKPEVIRVGARFGLYTLQVDTVARAIRAGRTQADSPGMSWDDSLGNMKTLDGWRKSFGLAWETEAPDAEAMKTPFTGRPLARRADHAMKYGKVPGIDKPVSRVVMGTMIYNPSEYPFTFAMLDYFFESGGNCIDLAYGYAGGQSEVAVGKWISTRGLREQLVLLDKGAHPPHTHPKHVTPQIEESLRRLGTDYLDLYCLHRDDPSIPVGEWVDVLDENRRAGRIRAFGGSNWSTARIAEANAYAEAKGIVGFTISSPNLSLARWNQPMWAGCISASDPDSRAWYAGHQIPIFAWSSQASGFFSGRLRPELKDSPDWYLRDAVRTWVNDANLRRLERARALASKKGVDAVQIAMAYVLSQPFPTFALIGPRTIEETRTSILGAGVELTPEEVRELEE